MKNKLFGDPRVKYIDIQKYIELSDSFFLVGDSNDLFFYQTESFLIIEHWKTVFTDFGFGTEDRLDYLEIAERDGKTEYDAINKKIENFQSLISRNPDNKKFKRDFNKYKSHIKNFPTFKKYKKAESKDCFDESIVDVDYCPLLDSASNYVVLDVETNGLSKKYDDLLSVTIYSPSEHKCYNRFLPLDMQPVVKTSLINGIKDCDLKDKYHLNQSEVDKIINYFDLNNKTILVYSGTTDFDSSFINNYLQRHCLTGFENVKYDNIKKHIPSGVFGFEGSASKDNMCKMFGIEGVNSVHTGLNDCLLEWKLFEKFEQFKPIRIGDKFYKFNKDYIIPITILMNNRELFHYANIPEEYILGSTRRIFNYKISEKALKKVKKFDTNITGISLENIIYSELNAEHQDNSKFLLENKKKLEEVATLETKLNLIDISVNADGYIEAINDKDKEFVKKVNKVASIFRKELTSVVCFIRDNIFKKDKIYSQELIIADNKKVLALCDLSSNSSILEIKTYEPRTTNLGYLDTNLAYQLYYQSNGRNVYYLSVDMITDLQAHRNERFVKYCQINIYDVELNKYSKEEYEALINKPTMFELSILQYLNKKPNATYDEMENEIGYSRKAIGRITKELQRKGLLERIGGNRKYSWVIKYNFKS